jgi:hypothetical protein
VLVATVILGIAVVGLLGNISTSMLNAARLTDYERAAMLAKRKVDELLIDRRLPLGAPLEGRFDPALMGGVPAGWQARLDLFEVPPNAFPGALILERLAFELWWGEGDRRRTLPIEAYRPAALPGQPEDQ